MKNKSLKGFSLAFIGIVIMTLFSACGTDTSSNYYNSGSSSSVPNYDMPKSGQSASEYIKEQDPELYNEMENKYYENSGSTADVPDYGKPKPGQTFSEYMKEQDPQLYEDMKNRWDSQK